MADTISNYKPSLWEALKQTGSNFLEGGQPARPGEELLDTPAPTAPLRDWAENSGPLTRMFSKVIPRNLGDVSAEVGGALPVVGLLAGTKAAREKLANITKPSGSRAGRIPYGYKKGMPRTDYLKAVEQQKWRDAAADVLNSGAGEAGGSPTSYTPTALASSVGANVAGVKDPAFTQQAGQDLEAWRKKKADDEIEAALSLQR